MNRTMLLISLMLWALLNSATAISAVHKPQAFLEQIAGTADEGEQIVQHYCATCHAETPLIPLGAPRAGYLPDWKERLKQGLETLFQHSSEGMNAMPARGGCFECTDEQLILAIKALLPKGDSPPK